MISFTKKDPHPALRDYVRNYWLLEGDGVADTLELLVPDGYPELFFVLHDTLRMQHFSNEKCWGANSEGGLIGQATSRFDFEPSSSSKVLFVKLYPWTPHQLFNIPACEVNNSAIELGAFVADPIFRHLNERLQHLPDLECMSALLDQVLLQKVHAMKAKNSFVQYAVRQMYFANGTISIDSLTQKVRASRRYVEKLFQQNIGLSPKHYAQVLRVKKATMYLLDPRFKGNIQQIASSLDYYDQSHLLKDFKSVVGMSPSAFVREKNLNFSEADLLTYLDQWDYS
jgi:AraC-like DNA-binding protein